MSCFKDKPDNIFWKKKKTKRTKIITIKNHILRTWGRKSVRVLQEPEADETEEKGSCHKTRCRTKKISECQPQPTIWHLHLWLPKLACMHKHGQRNTSGIGRAYQWRITNFSMPLYVIHLKDATPVLPLWPQGSQAHHLKNEDFREVVFFDKITLVSSPSEILLTHRGLRYSL